MMQKPEVEKMVRDKISELGCIVLSEETLHGDHVAVSMVLERAFTTVTAEEIATLNQAEMEQLVGERVNNTKTTLRCAAEFME